MSRIVYYDSIYDTSMTLTFGTTTGTTLFINKAKSLAFAYSKKLDHFRSSGDCDSNKINKQHGDYSSQRQRLKSITTWRRIVRLVGRIIHSLTHLNIVSNQDHDRCTCEC